MNKLPISLAIFSTTRGHYGHKNIYQTTITELSKNIPLCYFESLNIHIKRTDDDDAIFSEMDSWLKERGFNVIVSFGNWKHHDPSHFIEHGKDIATLMTNEEVQKSQYVMWLEDDVLLSGNNLFKQLAQAVEHLNHRPFTSAVRWLDFSQNTDSLLEIVDRSPEIILHQDVFSFRVSVLRARDVRLLGQFFRYDYPLKRESHIERYATEILRFFSGSRHPFAAFNLKTGRHIHIGSSEFSEQWVQNVIKTGASKDF